MCAFVRSEHAFWFSINVSFCSSCGLAGLNLYECGRLNSSGGAIYAVNGGESAYVSPWDEKPYEILPNGEKAYLDEQDIVTFLDPPKDLIPLDPTSYNPAAYIWSVFYPICFEVFSLSLIY